PPHGRMIVTGGEVHLDDAFIPGNAYLGYSYVDAENLLPLSDGVEVLHSRGGVSFKENYFGPLAPGYYTGQVGLPPINDSGKLHTGLFQYMLKLSQLRGDANAPAGTPA